MKGYGLKKRLRDNEITLGSWITIGNSTISEVLSQSDFDWLTIDMEHSVITLDIAQQMIQVIESYGKSPLVRVGENDQYLIKRVMDAGAHGVIIPMVNTKEDAERAVRSVRYPPKGCRGVGLARAQEYGFGFEKYKKWLEEESIVIVQIEHIEGVKNIDEILSVDGIDGFIVGPYDLSGSLGTPGEFDSPEFKKCIERLILASKEHEKPAGIHVIPPNAKEVKRYIDYGYRFIAVSLDTLFLGTLCKRVITETKKRFESM